MIDPADISQWLHQPFPLSEQEQQALDTIIRQYPYFIPARYMQAAELQKQNSFLPVMQENLKIYQGNWFMLYHLIQKVQDMNTSPIPRIEVKTAPAAEKPQEKPEESVAIPDISPVEKDPMVEVINTELEQEHGMTIPPLVPEFTEEPQSDDSQPSETASTSAAEAILAQVPPVSPAMETPSVATEQPFLPPAFADDYFRQQGIEVPDDIILPEETDELTDENDKSLMVMRSFAEWLQFFKKQRDAAIEEEEDKKALKSMWQKEKLAAAIEEEEEEIPEQVFEMAVNSITREEGLASESLAEILVKQGKKEQAIEMYRKLSLRNPQKSSYFVAKIDAILKDK